MERGQKNLSLCLHFEVSPHRCGRFSVERREDTESTFIFSLGDIGSDPGPVREASETTSLDRNGTTVSRRDATLKGLTSRQMSIGEGCFESRIWTSVSVAFI